MRKTLDSVGEKGNWASEHMNREEFETTLSSSSHPIKRILSSRQPGMVLLKYLLLLLLAIMGLLRFGFSVKSLVPPLIYKKEFAQDYLLTKAVLEGVDPYVSQQELAELFIGLPSDLVGWHTTPHPPPVAIFSLPLGLLTYEQAAVLWFLFETACILAAIYLLLRQLGKQPTLAFTVLITLFALSWRQFMVELVLGQLTSLLLVLLIGVWQALRSHKETLGGVLLGCMIALKLMAWPILFFLALRKRWRAVGAAGMVVATTNIAAALLMGFDKAINYYWKIGPAVASLFRAYYWNFSAWSIGWRLFEGHGSSIPGSGVAPAVITAPALAQFLSYILPVTLLTVGLVLSTKARGSDASFGILVCISILINPVAWSYYLLLALVPIAIVGRYLVALNFPKKETYIALGLGALLVFSSEDIPYVATLLAGQDPEAISSMPLIPGLLSLFVPLVGTLGLLWLVWHLDRVYPEKGFRDSR
jgi:hypothetical protein